MDRIKAIDCEFYDQEGMVAMHAILAFDY